MLTLFAYGVLGLMGLMQMKAFYQVYSKPFR